MEGREDHFVVPIVDRVTREHLGRVATFHAEIADDGPTSVVGRIQISPFAQDDRLEVHGRQTICTF